MKPHLQTIRYCLVVVYQGEIANCVSDSAVAQHFETSIEQDKYHSDNKSGLYSQYFFWRTIEHLGKFGSTCGADLSEAGLFESESQPIIRIDQISFTSKERIQWQIIGQNRRCIVIGNEQTCLLILIFYPCIAWNFSCIEQKKSATYFRIAARNTFRKVKIRGYWPTIATSGSYKLTRV